MVFARPRLFVLTGLPGSGKTTVAVALERAHRAVRLSADDVLADAGIDLWNQGVRATIEAAQRARVGELLAARRSVVVEWGSWTRAERDVLRDVARSNDARVELHLCDAPIDELLARLAARGREDPAITAADLRAWDLLLERPTDEELSLYDNDRPLRAATAIDHFDGDVAEAYDDVHDGADPAVEDAVDRLAALARDAPVDGRARALEFAIGTGRLAVPLQRRGIDVVGIDTSVAMLERLAAKGVDIEAHRGDMATRFLGARFGVVYLAFNTIMNLCSQEEQAACFANAAAHLVPGGRFVVEVSVPDLSGVSPTQRQRVFDLSDHHVGIDDHHDLVGQRCASHHLFTDGAGSTRWESTPFRWVWPSELDALAALAGLELDARLGDWDGTPFTDASPFHVSVWRRPTGR